MFAADGRAAYAALIVVVGDGVGEASEQRLSDKAIDVAQVAKVIQRDRLAGEILSAAVG